MRRAASRTSAKASGSRSSSDSPFAGTLAKLVGLAPELGVLEQLHLGLDPVDRLDPALVLLELLRLAHPQGAVDDSSGHGTRLARALRAEPGLRSTAKPSACRRRCSRWIIFRVLWRLRRFSRCFFTWRRMSSASSWIEWSMSGEASLARSVTPFSPRVASATIRSEIRGFFSSQSSTSRVANSETCLPTRWNRWTTASRSSSVTSTFLPRTSILTSASFRRAGGVMLRPTPPRGKLCLDASFRAPWPGSARRSAGSRRRAAPARRPRASRRWSRRRPPGERPVAPRRRPDPGRVGEPLPASPAHLAAAPPSSQAGAEGHPGDLRRRNRDLLGRVEAAPAPPPRAGRHRHDAFRGFGCGEAAQRGLGRHPGEGQPAPELEAVHDQPRDPVERRRRDRQVDTGRPGLDAPAAQSPARSRSARRGPPLRGAPSRTPRRAAGRSGKRAVRSAAVRSADRPTPARTRGSHGVK